MKNNTKTVKLVRINGKIPENYFSLDKKWDNHCGKELDQEICVSCFECVIANNMQIQYSRITKEQWQKKFFSPQ